MPVNLNEGQEFAHFTLLNRIGESDDADTWVGMDQELNEHVCLRIIREPLDDDAVDSLIGAVANARGLIHPNIVRVYEAGRAEDRVYISEQYIVNATVFDQKDGTFRQVWSMLESLIKTMAFAHELGFAHGKLHAGNLLVDGQGRLYIRALGLPASVISGPTGHTVPDTDEDKPADAGDDIYAIGLVLFRALTGRSWDAATGFTSGTPLPADVQAVLESMLASSAYDRTRDLGHVCDVLSRYVSELETAPIDSSVFTDRRTTAVTDTHQPSTHQTPRERIKIPTSLAVMVFVMIAGLAGFVFVYLPGNTVMLLPESPPTASEPAPSIRPLPTPSEPQSVPEDLAPMEIAQIEFAREEGKRVASQIIRRQVELEDIGVALWARATFESLVMMAESGDDEYREELYREALAIYRETIEALEQLSASAPDVLAENIARGEAALLDGDTMVALEAFSIATAIDSEDPSLQEKLTRAENLGEVQSMILSGTLAEDKGELDDALALYTGAAELDADWQPALNAVARVNQLILDREFDNAMSAGFSALASRDYDVARTSFDSAAQMKQDSTEPEDGILQIELAERGDRIESLKESAEGHASEERWQHAMDDFVAVLALDPSLVFASRGHANAERRLAIEDGLQKYLTSPRLMQDDGELAMAKQTVADASREATGERLASQMNDLSRLISVARIPIGVVIQSDNKTDITVYRVRHLGKISTTDLELVPGAYTIVGKRRGYRDVQHELRVMAGRTIGPVYISCDEKI